VKEFGTSHKVPRYDKLGFIRLNNLDVYFAFVVLIVLIIKLIMKIGSILIGVIKRIFRCKKSEANNKNEPKKINHRKRDKVYMRD
jgi:hypothetical protein